MAEKALKRKREVDMTEGSIVSLLLDFTVPLLLGNLFQQLYNTVDTWVVGNYVGKVSFSAVGTIGPILNTFIGFFTGLSHGASVVIARNFGAKNFKMVKESTHTFVALTLVLCVVFTILGIVLVPTMVGFMAAPREVAEQEAIYLYIYFGGVASLLLYNMGASILRAVGNSSFPFILLVICACVNIVLDLVFVIVFHMGTAGVAYATVISQTVSAFVVVAMLIKTDMVVKISIKDIKFNRQLLKEEIIIGLPSALQLSIVAFSNTFVQSYINYFGTDVMGGWTAYSKMDQVIFLPMQSMSLTATTFTGQNIGAGKVQRARKGTWIALGLTEAITVFLIAVVLFNPEAIVRIFIDSSETGVIYWGAFFLKMNSLFFVFACITQVFTGALRGAGLSVAPMIAMLASYVAFRQIYLFLVTRYVSNTPQSVGFGYPLGWIVCCITTLAFYFAEFPKPDIEEKG